MKIYGSTQYVSPEQEPIQWYDLWVVSQWDFKTKAVCYCQVGLNVIPMALRLNTRKSDTSYSSVVIEKLTDEMKAELESMGYIVSKNA